MKRMPLWLKIVVSLALIVIAVLLLDLAFNPLHVWMLNLDLSLGKEAGYFWAVVMIGLVALSLVVIGVLKGR